MLDREPRQYQDDLDAMHDHAGRAPADREAGVPDLGAAARSSLSEQPLGLKAAGAAAIGGDAARGIAEAALGGSGHDLPHKDAMEARFGVSLGDVSAHTGTDARSASRSIGAEAFTIGSRVGFASASPSQDTVAHEVTHVLQQTASRSSPASYQVSCRGSRAAPPSRCRRR